MAKLDIPLTDLLAEPDQPRAPNDERVSAQRRWSSSLTQVKLAVQFAAGFKTLRNQWDFNEVTPSQLKRVKKLGEGAFAVVEKCEYMAPGATKPVMVAVKKLRPEVTSDPVELDAFMKECMLMRKLKHKNIGAYLGMGSYDNSTEELAKSTLYLVEEYIGGGTLKQLVTDQIQTGHTMYTSKDAFRWLIQVASALAYLHTANPVVIHRDLKMDNILLTSDRQTAKLVDFGLAGLTKKAQEERLARAVSNALMDSTVTSAEQDQAFSDAVVRASSLRKSNSHAIRSPRSGPTEPRTLSSARSLKVPPLLSSRIGTLMYMAPEVYRGKQYTERVDVFGFGVIMWELMNRLLTICVVGNMGGELDIAKYVQRLSCGYRPPLKDSWPPALKQLISDCWAQDPNQRPDMTQVIARLQALEQSGLPEEVEAPMCQCTIS